MKTSEWRAGMVGAAAAGALLFLWFQIEHWLIWGSGYTDLPGQNTLRTVHRIQPYVIGLVSVLAGRVAGVLCSARRWLAALLSSAPLLALVAVSASGFSFWHVLAPVLAMIGAYPPVRFARQRATEPPRA